MLFIDARHIFTQIDRAHREFTPQQIEFLSNIVRLYRGEKPETEAGSGDLMKESFPKGKYADVLGLCKVATLDEIEAQGWSLNPGRYVGVAERAADDFEFAERLEELNEELETLNAEARELEERIAENVSLFAGKLLMTRQCGWKSNYGDVITLQRGFDLPERDRLVGSVPIVCQIRRITGYHTKSKVRSARTSFTGRVRHTR